MVRGRQNQFVNGIPTANLRCDISNMIYVGVQGLLSD